MEDKKYKIADLQEKVKNGRYHFQICLPDLFWKNLCSDFPLLNLKIGFITEWNRVGIRTVPQEKYTEAGLFL